MEGVREGSHFNKALSFLCYKLRAEISLKSETKSTSDIPSSGTKYLAQDLL